MAQPADKQPARSINVEMPADLEATYTNLALISHSASEVIIDFAQMMYNPPKAKVHRRVVMTPMNAKLLFRALAENLQKFEAKYGEIKIPDNIMIDPDRGFIK